MALVFRAVLCVFIVLVEKKKKKKPYKIKSYYSVLYVNGLLPSP